MQIEYFHFLNILKPLEVLQAIETLQGFNKSLNNILILELLEGNKIVDVSIGWPFEDAISVSLQLPFFRDYEEKGVRWIPSNDLHYGGSKYLSDKPVHIISTSQNK